MSAETNDKLAGSIHNDFLGLASCLLLESPVHSYTELEIGFVFRIQVSMAAQRGDKTATSSQARRLPRLHDSL